MMLTLETIALLALTACATPHYADGDRAGGFGRPGGDVVYGHANVVPDDYGAGKKP